MLIQILLLAISSSIDSLGVGMVYGFRHTCISRFSMFIIFIISLAVSFFSTIIGNFVNSFISPNVSSTIGSSILCIIGISVVFKCIFSKNDDACFDFDGSSLIDSKESIALGFALSADCFGIGFSYCLIGSCFFIFPFAVAIFQFVFLQLGMFTGSFLGNSQFLPSWAYSLFSGFLLIIIGIAKFFL